MITLPDIQSSYQKILTPSEYLNLTENERQWIEDVVVIPPRIGDNHFGKFLITFKLPMITNVKPTFSQQTKSTATRSAAVGQ